MRYFLIKQIHSGCSAFSSSDVFLKKEITVDEFKKAKKLIHDAEIKESEKYGFTILYTKADKTLYYKALRDRNALISNSNSYIDELKEIANSYIAEGWTEENEWLDKQTSKQWADEDKEEEERRTQEGYVIPKWKKDLPVQTYQGGFSEETFNHPSLQDYLNEGGCHGYIGHSVRKPELDAYIEKKFLEIPSNGHSSRDILVNWLSSKSGRHFGDSLECSSFEEQKTYIDREVNRLYSDVLSWID